jgi:hypothetical protein
LLGVPVSVLRSKLENFEAGTMRSTTGPLSVKVRRPVAAAWLEDRRERLEKHDQEASHSSGLP